MLRKFVTVFVLTFLLALMIPASAEAHNSCRRHRANKRSYAVRGYAVERRPSFYRRHRNVINLGAAAGGGALIGGLLGGNRRGMAAGALIGAGAGALYTYVLKPKKRIYR
jgi:hypothetical protein